MPKLIRIIWLFFLITGCASNKPQLEVLPESNSIVKESIDIRGKIITTYIFYHVVRELEKMNNGDVLEIITTNFEGIESDVRHWSKMTGQQLINFKPNQNYLRFYIEKGNPIKSGKKLAMIISVDGLEDLLAPLGFALAAELEGIDVSIYFMGPAVKMLKSGFKEKLHGFNRLFSGFARDELNEIGHIPPQKKLAQLKELGAKFYICTPSMDHFGVKKENIVFEDVIMSEYLTFMSIMSEADINLFVQ